jgi:hypothetical protein
MRWFKPYMDQGKNIRKGQGEVVDIETGKEFTGSFDGKNTVFEFPLIPGTNSNRRLI